MNAWAKKAAGAKFVVGLCNHARICGRNQKDLVGDLRALPILGHECQSRCHIPTDRIAGKSYAAAIGTELSRMFRNPLQSSVAFLQLGGELRRGHRGLPRGFRLPSNDSRQVIADESLNYSKNGVPTALRTEHKAEHNNCRMRGSAPKLTSLNPSVTV